MYTMLLWTTVLFIGATADDQGWVAVPKGVAIEYDLETIPLQIKTSSTIGSGEQVDLAFYDSQEEMTGVCKILFNDPPQFYFSSCTFNWINFPTNLPTGTDKVWTITLTQTSGIRLVIHYNEQEVLNFLTSDSTCHPEISWRTYYSKKVAEVWFTSLDTASDYYRPKTASCTGLKAEWRGTIETTAQFPVDAGTVVTVTCSESEALNKGSSEVTCVQGTEFSYLKEPSCSKPGCSNDGWMKCMDGKQCINPLYWCDGKKTCQDGSDEYECTSAAKQGQLVNSLLVTFVAALLTIGF